MLVRLDPRLTATAIAHVLENAAQYSPAGSPIEIGARVVRQRTRWCRYTTTVLE